MVGKEFDVDLGRHRSRKATDELINRVVGQVTSLPPDAVTSLVDDITTLYGDESAVKAMLGAATKMYGPQG